jgi:hypothetical protein
VGEVVVAMALETSVEVVGFEGDLPEGCTLTWGAAALKVGDTLVNGITGRVVPYETLDGFVEKHTVCLLHPPLPIPAGCGHDLFVVVVRSSVAVHKVVHDVLVEHAVAVGSGDVFAYAANTGENLDRMMAAACRAIVKHVRSTKDGSMITSGLILDAFHPELNALRVIHSDPRNRSRVLSLARICVKTTEGRVQFDDVLREHDIQVDWVWSDHVRHQ